MRIKILFLTLLLALSCLHPCYALGTKEHMERIEAIFWGEDGFVVKADNDDPAKKRWELLTNALYLCVDQVNANAINKNGSDQTALTLLYHAHRAEWLLYGLPTRIEEIDFAWNSGRHQGHTHKGWKKDYTKEFGIAWQQKWLLRKKILVSTISFEFSDFIDDEQLDSFCAWLYYLHIFEDLQADVEKHESKMIDEKYQFYQRSSETVTLAETISELIKYGNSLFRSSSKSQWERLKRNLSDLLDNANTFDITCKTEEEYMRYRECLSVVRETLKNNVPNLIQQEQFFEKAFPKI